MTISTTENKVVYTGNGTSTDFAYLFPVNDAAWMQVYLGNALQSTGYTVTGVGNASGGTVIFTVPPAVGISVVLLRVVPQTQQVDYRPYDPFPAEVNEAALDKLTMLVQQLQEQVDRAALGPIDGSLPPGTTPASAISFVAVGDISSINVQDAIAELQAETPDLSGAGATGTWGINITGNAATATDATNATNAVNATTTTTQAYGDADTNIASTAFVDRLRDVPANAQSTSYTLALTDRGQSIDTSAGVTVPDNATVAFPIGAVVSVCNTSTANITITQGANVTLRLAGTATTGNRTLAQFGMATMRKTATDTWVILGGGLT